MENVNNYQGDIHYLLKPSKWSVFWGIVMWTGLIVTLLWATLKALGYIHSPLWQELLPFYAIAITLSGGIFKLGYDMGDIRRSLCIGGKDTAALLHQQNATAQGFVKLETRMSHVDTNLQGIRTDVKDLRSKFGNFQLELKELSTEFKTHINRHHHL